MFFNELEGNGSYSINCTRQYEFESLQRVKEAAQLMYFKAEYAHHRVLVIKEMQVLK